MSQSANATAVELEATPRHSSRMVSRMVSGEHILVPLASRGADIDSIFNLNGTGTFIWEKINGQRTVAEIVGLMVSEFQVSREQAASDCGEFFAQLLEVRAIDFVDAKKE